MYHDMVDDDPRSVAEIMSASSVLSTVVKVFSAATGTGTPNSSAAAHGRPARDHPIADLIQSRPMFIPLSKIDGVSDELDVATNGMQPSPDAIRSAYGVRSRSYSFSPTRVPPSLAVKWLHLFRYEVRHVTECDFDGVTIQHRG